MVFFRTTDDANILGMQGSFDFETSKRKGNIAKRVSLSIGREHPISFYEELLVPRIVPSEAFEVLENQPIKVIVTSKNKVFTFQEFGCVVNFLTLNDDTGVITPISFANICPGEHSILCLDEDAGEDEWYLDDVEDTFVVFPTNEEQPESDVKAPELSRYMIGAPEGGFIINNIIII